MGFWKGYQYGRNENTSGLLADREKEKEREKQKQKEREEYDKNPPLYATEKKRSNDIREREVALKEKEFNWEKNKKKSKPGLERPVRNGKRVNPRRLNKYRRLTK